MRRDRRACTVASFPPRGAGHLRSLLLLQSLANPGSIVVSASTFRLTDGYFAFHSLGAAQTKGVSKPAPVYEVVGVGPLRMRLHVATRRLEASAEALATLAKSSARLEAELYRLRGELLLLQYAVAPLGERERVWYGREHKSRTLGWP